MSKKTNTKAETMGELERFISYLSIPRDSKDVRKNFSGIKKLFELAEEKGFSLHRTHDKKVFLIPTSSYEEKIFKMQIGVNSNGMPVNNVRLFIFPDKIHKKKVEKIRFIPMGDLKFGSPICDLDKFKQNIKWISRDEHVFTFFVGNMFDSTAAKNEDEADFLVKRLSKIIAPIRNKILFAIPGPEEVKLRKKENIGFDPLEKLLPEAYIQEFQAKVGIKFEGKQKIIKIFAIHGQSNAIITGAKINPLYNILKYADADVLVMANLKYAHGSKPINQEFNPETRKIEDKKVFLILVPAFEKYENSSDAMKGRPPQFSGSESFVFYREEGDVHLYTSSDINREADIIQSIAKGGK